MSEETGKLIGEVTHYFDNISVGIFKLEGTLKVGDEIRVAGGEDTDFSQSVDSMEVDHEKIKKAGKGDEVAIKIKEKVREGYKLYKL